MISNIQITKKMIEYANKHKLTVPKMVVNSNVWGNGKRTLAWRVSYHAFGVSQASALRTTRLEKLLFPNAYQKPTILKPDYTWRGTPLPVHKHPGIVWHHAAGTGTPEQIHQIHLSIGDRGIAYHFYVRKDGRIYQGRPLGTWGAHCLGHNDWIGVCAEGNYDSTKLMPAAQLRALKNLHHYLHAKYDGIPDKQHKYMSGNSTACPGRYFPYSTIVNS